MLGFRKTRPHPQSGSHAERAYRYRVDSRRTLLDRYELVSLSPERRDVDDREKLALVLEEASADGWRLVGVSGDDFVFRRRR